MRIQIFNIGFIGFLIAIKNKEPLNNVNKGNGAMFEFDSKEELLASKKEYYSSDYKKYNDTLREIAKNFKARA